MCAGLLNKYFENHHSHAATVFFAAAAGDVTLAAGEEEAATGDETTAAGAAGEEEAAAAAAGNLQAKWLPWGGLPKQIRVLQWHISRRKLLLQQTLSQPEQVRLRALLFQHQQQLEQLQDMAQPEHVKRLRLLELHAVLKASRAGGSAG
jgi:hypothetical protein